MINQNNYVECRTDKGFRILIPVQPAPIIIEDEVKGVPVPKLILANGQAITLAGDNMETLCSKIEQARGGEGFMHTFDKPSAEALATLPGTSTDVVRAAKICHEVNRIYCESIGDMSQPIWSVAPKWAKDSAIHGVLFCLQNLEAGPDAQHNAWLASREADGWVYGEEKDAEKKTHPCMVPFDQLPPEQQFKDVLFAAVVRASF